jgi:transcriptional regulator with XRE-family HTH domain
MNMKFADKVKSARAELGLTQTELGDKVGVSLRTILSYEKGEKKPRSSNLLRLASALNVSTRFLTDDSCEDPMADISKDGYISQAREKHSGISASDAEELLNNNRALFAGGELDQEAKDAFFEAVMRAYIACKDESEKRYGKKKQ